MAKSNLKTASENVTDFPVRIFADPNMDGVQLTRDLASVGLELAKDGRRNFWLRRLSVRQSSPVTTAMDMAHLHIENAESMVGVCVEALNGGACAHDVAITLNTAVHDQLESARDYIHRGMDVAKGDATTI